MRASGVVGLEQPGAQHAPLLTVGDPELHGHCTRVPGSPQRMREIVALRTKGWSLDEIAARYEVSRERVRQLLRAHGGPDAHDVSDARRRRAEQRAELCVDELLAMWRSGLELGRAANVLGLPVGACRGVIARFATDVDRAARGLSMSRARRQGSEIYSDRDILDALKTVAAQLGHVPSPKQYEALARDLKLASVATVLVRMGDWSSAIRAAGMRPRVAARRVHARRWTEDACWIALRRVVEDMGEIPSVLSYERHVADRSDLPSARTVRNRLGRWSSIVTRLAAESELMKLHRQQAPALRGAAMS